MPFLPFSYYVILDRTQLLLEHVRFYWNHSHRTIDISPKKEKNMCTYRLFWFSFDSAREPLAYSSREKPVRKRRMPNVGPGIWYCRPNDYPRSYSVVFVRLVVRLEHTGGVGIWIHFPIDYPSFDPVTSVVKHQPESVIDQISDEINQPLIVRCASHGLRKKKILFVISRQNILELEHYVYWTLVLRYVYVFCTDGRTFSREKSSKINRSTCMSIHAITQKDGMFFFFFILNKKYSSALQSSFTVFTEQVRNRSFSTRRIIWLRDSIKWYYTCLY